MTSLIGYLISVLIGFIGFFLDSKIYGWENKNRFIIGYLTGAIAIGVMMLIIR